MRPKRIWKRWHNGRDVYSLDAYNDVCPKCYYSELAKEARIAVNEGGPIKVMEHWRRLWRKWDNLAFELGACECAKPSEAGSPTTDRRRRDAAHLRPVSQRGR